MNTIARLMIVQHFEHHKECRAWAGVFLAYRPSGMARRPNGWGFVIARSHFQKWSWARSGGCFWLLSPILPADARGGC